MLTMALALAALSGPAQDGPGCGSCAGSGTVVSTCGTCAGTGVAGYTSIRGQMKALGCEACGGFAGNEYSGRQGSGRSAVPCRTCDGSGAGPARVAEIRRERAEAARKAKEEAERKAKEEAERPFKVAREKALEEERRLAEQQTAEARRQNGLVHAEKVLRELQQRLSRLDQGELFEGQVLRDLPSLGGPLVKTLFEKGSRDSAPVDLRPGERPKLDAGEGELRFAPAPGSIIPPTGPGSVTQVPDEKDMEFLFPGLQEGWPAWLPRPETGQAGALDFAADPDGKPARPRWPGPRNPGPRLKNPLIEAEKNERWISEHGWDFLRSGAQDEVMFELMMEDETLRALGVPPRAQLTDAQSRILTERVRASIGEQRMEYQTLKDRTARDMLAELEKMREAGRWKNADDYVRKETFDAGFRKDLDEARDRVLRSHDQRMAEVRRKLDAEVKDVAEKILKDR